MTSLDSVSGWIAQLEGGDDGAAEKLWERYFRRLVGLARTKLRDTPRQAADEEDVALSAFDSFCRGTQEGRFPQLSDRDDLWRLLVAITVRKAIDLTRHERRQKRAGGAVIGVAPPPAETGLNEDEAEIERILGREPTPELAAQVADECARLLETLEDASLRSVALGKMEGYSDAEIATQLGCARRTVVRKLRRIRGLWSQETTS
jgi:DNA-directed RNA polymerase specialized sigma24 family protein